MTTYIWNVTSGNFGAASSWNPNGTPTSSDQLFIYEVNSTGNALNNISLFGSGSGANLYIATGFGLTITQSLHTTISNYVDIVGADTTAVVNVDAAWTNSSVIFLGFGYSDLSQEGILNVNAGGSITTANIDVGEGGGSPFSANGVLTVQGGGTVTTNGPYFDEVGAKGSEGTSTLTVTGAGSSWTSANGLNIGDTATGQLTVEKTAVLNTPQLDVGVNYDQQTIASGTGTALIESGGVVTTTGQYQEIGSDATGSSDDVIHGATGAVTVDGAGSQWNANNGQIAIGDAGSTSGSLTISNGGAVKATNGFQIGTEWNGADGSYGSLTIESGGTATTGSWSTVGTTNAASPVSNLTITGAGSKWTAGNLVFNTSAQALVTAGGTLDVTIATSDGGLGMNGGLLKVDSTGTLEDGDAGGAALGFLTVDPDPNFDSNLWGHGTIEANVIDNGQIYTDEAGGGGALTIMGPTGVKFSGTLTGDGALFVGAESTLNLDVASVASSLFVGFSGLGATLQVSDFGFSAPIHNFALSDTIDVAGLYYYSGSTTYTFTPSGQNNGGTLVVTYGSSSVTLDIASSQAPISGNLTLSSDGAGGTDVTFTNAASASPFHLWSQPGSLFNTPSGIVDGMDYGLSAHTDGGAPVWMETETPASSYVAGSGSPANYTIVLATQDWLGDVQPEITVATDNNFVDPFVNNQISAGNLGAATIFSNTSTTGYGGIVYWTASSTAGDYAVKFEPFTVSYPTAPANADLVSVTGSPVTMIAAVANPINWTFSDHTSTSMVFAYMAENTSTTENLYFQGFNNQGVATSADTEVASNFPNGTPYFIGYYNGTYEYRYLQIGSSVGSGLVGGSFNYQTGAVGAPSLLLDLPNYTSFTGIASYLLSNNNSVRFVKGVENGQAVFQVFVNNSTTPAQATATFNLSSAGDHWATTTVYDPNTGGLDYMVLAYTDNNQVHLELIDENGKQIGGDLVAPGLTSFLQIHTLQGSNNPSSTRVELDYAVADPNGGQEVQSVIYDTIPYNDVATLSGGGLWNGTPFDDTFTWGTGVYTIDGGGGDDTFVATNFASSQVTLSIDAAGEVVVSDGAGDVDTLRRFTTIKLADATVTIAGNVLTAVKSDGTKTVSTFNISGKPYVETVQNYTASGALLSTEEYDSSGHLVGTIYATQVPNDFTGDGRSDLLFNTIYSDEPTLGGLASWSVNDATVTGGGNFGNPGVDWTYQGAADLNGDGRSDVIWRNRDGEIDVWEMNGTAIIGSGPIGYPGGSFNVVGFADFAGDGATDILFQDASGNLAFWKMSGASIVGGGTLGNPGASWTYLGTGDFNGDGKSDLLFEDTSTGQYATWLVNGTTVVGGALLGQLGSNWVYKGIGDFTGAGNNDILFENANTGEYATWSVTGDAVTGGADFGSPGAPWTLAAIGTYSSSGQSDLLFRNTQTGAYASWDVVNDVVSGGGGIGNPGGSASTANGLPALDGATVTPTLVFNDAGNLATWTVSNGIVSGGGDLGNPGSNWTELAIGDFYGDGQTDVLFQNTVDKSYAIWRTNGSQIVGGASIGSASGYTFQGVGDFNGDGTSDILFKNLSTGDYATWEMNGASIIGGADWGQVQNLNFVATGDFNGDGTSDVLFADGSGNYYVAPVVDGQEEGAWQIGAAPGFTFEGVGDLNGDGKADIVFKQNSTGDYWSWDMNGEQILSSVDLGNPGANWTFEGIAALNSGGHDSLVFENVSTGQVATWEMNDTQIVGGATLGYAPGFTLVGVR